MMISIITAVHNGLAFNKIFFESVKKYTYHPFELIIIDNNSTDGSREYFERNNAKLIYNTKNFSYPVCQNQGIKAATYDYLFFLNNDLVLCPSWDKKLIDTAALHGLDVITSCGIENLGDKPSTAGIDRKWKRVKNLLSVFGFGEANLRFMLRLMYGNWEQFCAVRFNSFHHRVAEGIVGNNVMITRRGLSCIGLWDERIQQADWDIFIRTKKRADEYGDIKPCGIALGVYIHHYIRMTAKYAVKPVQFADLKNMIYLGDKWGAAEIEKYHPNNATLRK